MSILTTPYPAGPVGIGERQGQDLQARRLRTTNELRACAPAWDRLWHASTCVLPTLRAEPIALWCDSFLHATALDAVPSRLKRLGQRPLWRASR